MKKGTLVRYNGNVYQRLQGLRGVVQATFEYDGHTVSTVRWFGEGNLAPAKFYMGMSSETIFDNGTDNYFNCATADLVCEQHEILKTLKRHL